VDPVGGITNVNLPEADLKRVMVASSGRALVVADGSKLGRTHVGRIAALEDVAGLLTGESADADAVRSLRAAGLSVTIA
jgi:DeoR family transcriptional regulator of aga operon